MVFERWVTPGQADADLLRLARLTTAAAENREFDLPKTKPAASGRAVDGIEERDGVADAPRPRVAAAEERGHPVEGERPQIRDAADLQRPLEDRDGPSELALAKVEEADVREGAGASE